MCPDRKQVQGASENKLNHVAQANPLKGDSLSEDQALHRLASARLRSPPLPRTSPSPGWRTRDPPSGKRSSRRAACSRPPCVMSTHQLVGGQQASSWRPPERSGLAKHWWELQCGITGSTQGQPSQTLRSSPVIQASLQSSTNKDQQCTTGRWASWPCPRPSPGQPSFPESPHSSTKRCLEAG